MSGAHVVTAASGKYDDVKAAVDLAKDGDTVAIPKGEETWSSTLMIDVGKAVNIIGAGSTGSTTTVIHNDVGPLFVFQGTNDKPLRVACIRFDNVDKQASMVALAGPISKARVDHCVFNKGDNAIGTNSLFNPVKGAGPVYGVVDHCQFNNMSRAYFAMDIRKSETGNVGAGSSSWAEGIHPGTDQMMYFEDNEFLWDQNLTEVNAQGALYGQWGGKAVFRHNKMSGFCSYFDAHGDGGPGDYSTTYYEIYDNTFTEDDTFCFQGDIGWQRGGQWIVHDNVFTGKAMPLRMSVYFETDALERRVQNTYFWGNTWNGSADQAGLVVVNDSGQTSAGYSADHIKVDQQYFLHEPQPGQTYYPYKPLVYPHPLATP